MLAIETSTDAKPMMKFTKMHGAGNDYVYVNCFDEPVPDDIPGLAQEVSDRHFGIGGDGLILIRPSEQADAWMHMLNADGSEAEMCGNGIRCVAKYVYDHGIAKKDAMRIQTGAGVLSLKLSTGTDGLVESVTVNMGEPELEAAHIPTTIQPTGRVVDQEIEVDERFPKRVNVEFVEVISPTEVRQRTWERGSGETWACGTGASAVCVAGVLTGKTENKILNHLRGGDLTLHWDEATNNVHMTGGAVEVFSGQWNR